MNKRPLTLLTAVVLLAFVGTGCSQAPSIPHPSEDLEPVDCLACHELGLKGATRVPQGHFGQDGTVRYENCACHKPAPVEEQTSGAQSSRRLGITASAVALSASGLAVTVLGRRRKIDG